MSSLRRLQDVMCCCSNKEMSQHTNSWSDYSSYPSITQAFLWLHIEPCVGSHYTPHHLWKLLFSWNTWETTVCHLTHFSLYVIVYFPIAVSSVAIAILLLSYQTIFRAAWNDCSWISILWFSHNKSSHIIHSKSIVVVAWN